MTTKRWSKLRTKCTKPFSRFTFVHAVLHENYVLFLGTVIVPKAELAGRMYRFDVLAFNLRTMIWTRLHCTGDVPWCGRCIHAPVINGNDLYVICCKFDYGIDVFHLNLNDPRLEWKLLNHNSNVLYRFPDKAIFYKKLIIAFDSHTFFSVDIFDISVRSWCSFPTLPDLVYGYPHRRKHYSLAENNGFIYIAGGINSAKIEFDDLWQFDIEKTSWLKAQFSLPRPQGCLRAISSKNDCLYLINKNFDKIPPNAVERSEFYRIWLTVPPLKYLAARQLENSVLSTTQISNPDIERSSSISRFTSLFKLCSIL